MRLLSVAILATASAFAQAPVAIPEVRTFNQGVLADPSGFYKTPGIPLIPRGPGARAGRVWVAATSSGLRIDGVVEGPAPAWPGFRQQLLSKDHVEIWLATQPEAPLPPIGWGNQFGEVVLESEKDCQKKVTTTGAKIDVAQCRAWYAKQVRYRALFSRLFTRQWLVAGGPQYSSMAVESFALDAFTKLATEFSGPYLALELAPPMTAGVRSGFSAASRKSGYAFWVEIPYSSFPPLPTLSLEDLWIMVDVFSATPTNRRQGDYSTTSTSRRYGVPPTFNRFRLERPVFFQITPCGLPLRETNSYVEPIPAYIYPVPEVKDARPVRVESVLALENTAEGYLYDPGGVSPVVGRRGKPWMQASDGAYYCGSPVTRVKGKVRTEAEVGVGVDEARVFPDAWTMLRHGPLTYYTRFGSGQCGACSRAMLDFKAVSPEGEFFDALEIEERIGEDYSDADFEISPDWKTITMFLQETANDKWISKTWRLVGHEYEEAGENLNAKPPNPRRFRPE